MLNYNFNIQQQLTPKVAFQVGYVGSTGHRLWRFFDINQPSQAAINTYDLANGIACYACVPRVYGYGPSGATYYILQENSTGKSNYNSLQASLRLDRWHGVTSVMNYVWSKSLDNSSDGEDFEPNAAQPNDSTQPNLEYGPSNFNVPLVFAGLFVLAGLGVAPRGESAEDASAGLIVGLESPDDAAVHLVAPGVAVIGTVDFFPPMVDDPRGFGRVGAANSVSTSLTMLKYTKLDPNPISTRLVKSMAVEWAQGNITAPAHMIVLPKSSVPLGFAKSQSVVRHAVPLVRQPTI